MNTNPLLALKARGQHIWLDHFSRTLLREGGLQRLIDEDGVDGVVSNLLIYQRALVSCPLYGDDLARLRGSGLDAEARYEALLIADAQMACDLLAATYGTSGGETGYVSLDLSPSLAHDAAATEAAALRLCQSVGRDNLLVKVPATPAGLVACENLIAQGVGINVTLIFSVAQYEVAAQAYLRGARRWLAAGGSGGRLRSVVSVFLNRVDKRVDKHLAAIGTPLARVLRGRTGVALAKGCYQRYLELFHDPANTSLVEAGVRPQTPLWTGVGGKNPAYGDVLHVEALIGPETISTLGDTALAAFRARGQAFDLLVEGLDKARYHIMALAGQGIELGALGDELQSEGLDLLADEFGKTLASV